MAKLPLGFVERMTGMLGDEVPAFLDALLAPETGLRVNSLRLTPGEFESFAPFDLNRLAYPPEGYAVTAQGRPGKHPYHAAGLYYIQDPGAMVVGALVGALPGERVLDLSAAPGGKATQLAAAMENTGVLVANDVSRARALELLGNIERCGVTNAIVTTETAERLAAHFGAWFDRVLVDAPCSGESMFGRSDAALRAWTPGTVAGCARRQRDLLQTAADLVRPGGVLCYSTCTFATEENEGVVERFLRARPDYALAAELPAVTGAQAVMEHHRAGPEVLRAAALRLWPHRTPGAGHFVAMLRRVGGEPDSPGEYRYSRPGTTVLEGLCQFLESTWTDSTPPLERVDARGSTLLVPPAGAPDLAGLKVIRAGLELGEMKPGRFEPAHALALAVPPATSPGKVDLPVDAPEVSRYLEGHPISSEGPPGWWPVAVDGYALGWGKRVGATVKNHYPKGLRQTG